MVIAILALVKFGIGSWCQVAPAPPGLAAHDGPAIGVLEPLVSNLLGPTQHATDFSGSTQHGASLLDTAGAIPTAALPPLPLHLGFLGQPTIDGHETHDGAFSALGVHHF